MCRLNQPPSWWGLRKEYSREETRRCLPFCLQCSLPLSLRCSLWSSCGIPVFSCGSLAGNVPSVTWAENTRNIPVVLWRTGHIPTVFFLLVFLVGLFCFLVALLLDHLCVRVMQGLLWKCSFRCVWRLGCAEWSRRTRESIEKKTQECQKLRRLDEIHNAVSRVFRTHTHTLFICMGPCSLFHLIVVVCCCFVLILSTPLHLESASSATFPHEAELFKLSNSVLYLS